MTNTAVIEKQSRGLHKTHYVQSIWIKVGYQNKLLYFNKSLSILSVILDKRIIN